MAAQSNRQGGASSAPKGGKTRAASDGRGLVTAALDHLRVPVAELRLYPGNPRRGDVAAIAESLRHHGQYRPVVVNRRGKVVLAGNHVVEAARTLGWVEVAAVFIDVGARQARRIVLADNRTADLATYDPEALLALLEELPDLAGTAYDEDALAELLAEVRPVELPGPEEEVPAAPQQPRTVPGDCYRLGRHRLVCGDATDPSAYELLLRDRPADLLWTDPPYGVAYTGRTKAKLRIRNDSAAALHKLLAGAFSASDIALSPGAPLYVAHPAGPLSLTFGNCCVAQGWSLRQTLVWAKDSLVLGGTDYHYKHEPIYYGFKPGPGRLGRGGRGWHGSNAKTSVLEFARPRAAREHPTMKPPELIAACVRNSSAPRGRVLDPFAGSGSTLVACEATGRSARLIELEPRYCDVIVDRYERLTGEPATLERGQ